MSIREYYAQRVFDIQSLLQKQGQTESQIWDSLTDQDELSPAEFAVKITEMGVPITPNESKIIWKMCGIYRSLLRRTDLTSLLDSSPDDFISDENTPPPEDILMESRKTLLSLCLEKDTRLYGIVSTEDLESIAKQIDPSLTHNRMSELISKLDMFQTGRIDYFLLLSQLCTRKKKMSYTDNGSYPFSLSEYTGKRTRKRHSLEPVNEYSRRPMDGRRGPLDEELFSTRMPRVPVNPIQEEMTYDHLQTVEGAGRREILALISKTVDLCYKSRKKCYKKWKGYDEYLQAEGIQRGMAKAAHVYIPLVDLDKVTALYGESLSLSSFVKMVGDGARFLKTKNLKRIERNKVGASTIRYIARHLSYKDWKSILSGASTSEELIERMKDEGIYLTNDETTTLAKKMDRDEIVSAIENAIEQM